MRKIFLLTVVAAMMVALSACSDEKTNEYIAPEAEETLLDWDGMCIDTAEEDQWGLARSGSWVALTDYDNRTQYHLSWTGGMTNGEKTDAMMRVALNGDAPVEYPLTTCKIEQDGVNCTITFADSQGREGRFTFAL